MAALILLCNELGFTDLRWQALLPDGDRAVLRPLACSGPPGEGVCEPMDVMAFSDERAMDALQGLPQLRDERSIGAVVANLEADGRMRWLPASTPVRIDAVNKRADRARVTVLRGPFARMVLWVQHRDLMR